MAIRAPDGANKYSHNFQNIASKRNQRWVINYDKPLIHFGTDILKIVEVLWGLKVDLVSPVWPPAPSKVSLSEKLSMILGVFRCFFWTK